MTHNDSEDDEDIIGACVNPYLTMPYHQNDPVATVFSLWLTMMEDVLELINDDSKSQVNEQPTKRSPDKEAMRCIR